ncbi:MAG: bifunctional UDP-N-acetylglucosamine pyrophosphorylase / Glucosamine-1-phosphate N-acetyltransferase [Candidatus Berkelbacteria bacterium Licking1014_96]|uniref:Bifunctional UDP-N-acetylglucosamine pyrophosphorylase / Glucosamine-1-phosphate N-acetyltransferase n=1 Tax=Candidatus Berkelbacteria bacterium Licking1014_96 TaxID=2017149 RepID=A0A554LEF9_9BACT|nr:MAG: bifunctional UDP-N-acetylglucosamine pyrophosphorylase / Glucosamine-1-phosphate N-acetyltransferase [Candidatus Berkelbacteria bacterium Licking1014_96]
MPDHDLPKVLYPIGGKPMIKYLIKAFKDAGIHSPIIVVGYKKELVMKELGKDYEYAVQEEQLGTGHAVLAARDALAAHSGLTFIAYGDMPFWSAETIEGMINLQELTGVVLVIASAEVGPDYAYGRIVRDQEGRLVKIVEEKDCTKKQLKIKETNGGLYLVDNTWLFESLIKIDNQNAKKEYYLTDLISIAVEGGRGVEAYQVQNPKEAIGVNDEKNVKAAEDALNEFGLSSNE